MATGATQYLENLEIRERQQTGIDTLKIGYNAVHGYYIQISRGQAERAPTHYIRRQTLKNAERFIIPELKDYEDKVLKAKGAALALENSFTMSFRFVIAASFRIANHQSGLSRIDVLANLAERAETLNYVASTFSEQTLISIEAGRHPVVETVLQDPFIANPLDLNQKRHLLIITGPNMGGKVPICAKPH